MTRPHCELCGLNEWLAQKYGVKPPILNVRKELFQNGTAEGEYVPHLPILQVSLQGKDPAQTLAHEFHHYLQDEAGKGTLVKKIGKGLDIHDKLDARADRDLAEYRKTT